MGHGVEQNWQEAVKWYEQGAQCGDLQSMHNLACCYEGGEGVEQNEDRAFYWYRRSAEGGNGSAMCNLGRDVYKRQAQFLASFIAAARFLSVLRNDDAVFIKTPQRPPGAVVIPIRCV